MTAASYALTIFLYLNSLATSTLAQDRDSGDTYDPANERVNNEPEGAVTTSKLQVHVSSKSIIISMLFVCAFYFQPMIGCFINIIMFNEKYTPANCYSVLLFLQSSIHVMHIKHMNFIFVQQICSIQQQNDIQPK